MPSICLFASRIMSRVDSSAFSPHIYAEYFGHRLWFSPLRLILKQLTLAMLCHAIQHLTLTVEMQLQPNLFVRVPIPLNLDKCIASYLPCHAYHLDHAGSSLSVVVRFASVVCSSICFFPERITKWCCEIRQVLLQLFTGEPSLFTSSPSHCYPYVALLYRVTSPIPLVYHDNPIYIIP